MRVVGGGVGDGHRLNEVLLEVRFGGGLDLYDLGDQCFDLSAGGRREQGHYGACSRGVASCGDLVNGTVGNEAEGDRVHRVDVAAECACEPDGVDVLDASAVHQELDPCIEGCLG